MGAAGMGGLAATIVAIERGADMDTLRRSVRAFAGPLGYDRFILYAASLSGDGIVEQLLWMEGNWVSEGSEFDPETYLARCPVNRHVLETDHPFFWTKTGEPGHDAYRIVRRPSGPGIHGLQVPVFGHAGLIGAMSFGGPAIDSTVDTRSALTLVAIAAFYAAQRLAGPNAPTPIPHLSDRELEVMRWVASGRRQVDIALMLGLSERTIENHLRRIRKRLGATSTAQAMHLVVRAGSLEA
jgi:LuxR family quorum sensing-dependent transcriptional regulator